LEKAKVKFFDPSALLKSDQLLGVKERDKGPEAFLKASGTIVEIGV